VEDEQAAAFDFHERSRFQDSRPLRPRLRRRRRRRRGIYWSEAADRRG